MKVDKHEWASALTEHLKERIKMVSYRLTLDDYRACILRPEQQENLGLVLISAYQ